MEEVSAAFFNPDQIVSPNDVLSPRSTYSEVTLESFKRKTDPDTPLILYSSDDTQKRTFGSGKSAKSRERSVSNDNLNVKRQVFPV